MPPPATVRAVVVTWNGAHLLPACLDSLEAQTVRDRLEVVVVDNASQDGTTELLADRYPDVHVLRALPGGGTLIGSRKGWFVARETGGKFALTPAGQADAGRVNHLRDFGGAVLIGGESGLFVATAAPGCGGR